MSPSDRRRHRQRVAFVTHASVECGVPVERDRSSFGERLVKFLLRVVLLAVVWTEVEVGDDLHRPIQEGFEDILLDECLADSFKLGEIELRPEMVEDRVAVGGFL